ncbi:MAG: 30S ribosomal protein S8 [Acidobacteria bacterium]|nr:30S ribosomal protein S8 [Acidobacteriota bacterium]
MMTDPIADMLTRIRNGLQAKHDSVLVPSSGLKKEIARILSEEGFVGEVKLARGENAHNIELTLKYVEDREPVIRHIERVSKPGRRVYCDKEGVPVVLNGLGVAIVSTSQGVLTDRRCRELGVGGEVICRVW